MRRICAWKRKTAQAYLEEQVAGFPFFQATSFHRVQPQLLLSCVSDVTVA